MVLGKEGEDMRGGCKHMKVLLRPCHSWSVFAVHQEWLCPGPDCQSWGILEERQATAELWRGQDSAFHLVWVWSFPWWTKNPGRWVKAARSRIWMLVLRTAALRNPSVLMWHHGSLFPSNSFLLHHVRLPLSAETWLGVLGWGKKWWFPKQITGMIWQV